MTDADWLSYSLSDFLMFGPEVFLRLFVRINQDVWPWQAIAVVMMVLIAGLLVRGNTAAKRAILLLLAAAWVWSGAGFLMEYYGPINSPATWFGWAFILQGSLLTVAALVCPWERTARRAAQRWQAGTGWLVVTALLPFLVVAQTGNWQSLALFGITPDLTVAASVPCLLMFPRRVRWVFLLLPLLWALFSMATLWALGIRLMLVLPAVTLVLAIAGFRFSPRPAQSPG
ncbi:DUF6064 family protein [Marinobacter sp. HL-58]|uniref:DUF6064 family protein n=1 Tax=Marinobacter sp. HL-58 TaxID=1479237 RepID=UPI0004889FD6|nr:DUF6064 family protein [Marinobacter sp. HL-58]KPP98056.1 MAG: hypothetical protein HLUCCO03_08040 [Marinobacter sp. HL-58]